MTKSLIIYDEELYANGLEILLKRIDPTSIIVNKSLTDDLANELSKQYETVYIIKADNKIEEIITQLYDYNPCTHIVAIIDKLVSSDAKLFKKRKLYAMLDKKYNSIKIENIIRLVMIGDRYFPTDVVMQDKPLLSKHQISILQMAGKGSANKQIAYDLGIAESTVKTHFSHIMKKLGCVNRVGAIRKAMDLGLID